MSNFPRFRRPAQLALVATLLGAGLSSCGSSSNTATVTPTGTYILTVKFSGTSKSVPVTLTDSSGNQRTFKLDDGGTITNLLGVYTVTAGTVDGTTPAAQTVDLSGSSQSITFNY